MQYCLLIIQFIWVANMVKFYRYIDLFVPKLCQFLHKNTNIHYVLHIRLIKQILTFIRPKDSILLGNYKIICLKSVLNTQKKI